MQMSEWIDKRLLCQNCVHRELPSCNYHQVDDSGLMSCNYHHKDRPINIFHDDSPIKGIKKS